MSLNFEKYQAEANEFLNQAQVILATPDRDQAGRVVRSVLHALRDRLPVSMAANLASQLPMIWKGIYFDGFDPDKLPLNLESAEEFIEYVRSKDAFAVQMDFPTDNHVISAFNCVLDFLRMKMSEGQVEKVVHALPEEIKDLINVPVLDEVI